MGVEGGAEEDMTSEENNNLELEGKVLKQTDMNDRKN